MRLALAAASVSLLGACASGVAASDDDTATRASLTASAETRRTMGSFFLVEQPATAADASMMKLMASGPPGGLCFWNPGHVSGAAARPIIKAYSRAAQAAGSPPLLYSTDYEGGGLSLSPSGKSIAGVQRYVTGMTPLAHPRWLGKADRKDAALGKEIAHLHGYIMSRELRSIGINYPLGTISDLADGLFATRGIDTDSSRVATLMGQVVEGALSVANMMFVTKHFPGLGLTSGDTHEVVVVAPMYSEATAQSVLSPFQAAVNTSIRVDADARLSVLASHAKFPYWDNEFNTTTSSKILDDVLRSDVGFGGVVVSDAMWMAPYGSMTSAQVQRVYVQSFLAGIDMLMIPHVRYAGALTYFRAVADNTLGTAEQVALSAVVGMPYATLRGRFLDRVTESRGRLDAARALVGYAHESMDADGTTPTSTTVTERARYNEILKQLDARLP